MNPRPPASSTVLNLSSDVFEINAIFINGIQHIHAFSGSLPPKLTVNPSVITETDSVTLNCQTPPSVSQCQFFTLSGHTVREFSCLRTLTGTELLKMSSQNSPAEVKVKCFYIIKLGKKMSQSPDSETASVTFKTQSE